MFGSYDMSFQCVRILIISKYYIILWLVIFMIKYGSVLWNTYQFDLVLKLNIFKPIFYE